MRAWILEQYEAARRAGLPNPAAEFPALVQRYFNNVSAYEPAEFIRLLVGGGPQDVLVVGVGGGRDHYWLSAYGHRVRSIDIAYQRDIPSLVQADMSRLPFNEGVFDCVVVADALEHTFQDRDALIEFRRVLRRPGRLVVNIPFGDDAGEHHVRVYTEPTFRRLLESAGFVIDRRIYRGVVPLLEQRVPGLRHLFHAANTAAYIICRRTCYRSVLAATTSFDWRRGQRAGLRRFARVHGAYVAASAVDNIRDFGEVNRLSYNDQAATIAAGFIRRQGKA